MMTISNRLPYSTRRTIPAFSGLSETARSKKGSARMTRAAPRTEPARLPWPPTTTIVKIAMLMPNSNA
jgi:hypothetical protein